MLIITNENTFEVTTWSINLNDCWLKKYGHKLSQPASVGLTIEPPCVESVTIQISSYLLESPKSKKGKYQS